MKKILVLGATGAMGLYLIPELLNKNYKVVGVSLDDAISEDDNLTYIKENAKDLTFLTELLKNNYDAVVDFMVYPSKEDFEKYQDLFLTSTKHYIYTSTYRVYADDSPLHENAKRLYDVSKPDDFVLDGEYSIYKAQQEDMLNNSGYNNYTIIRPAITYSKRRFQLTTLEADVLVYRMLNGKTVILPEGAMDKQATMSWAGDVAKMICEIILNPKAYTQTYNVSTAEHITWREVAEIYEKIGNLKYITVDNQTYLDIVSWNPVYSKQQLLYDRCFNRIVDNSKILELCDLKQSDLMPLEQGLKMELSNLNPKDISCSEAVNSKMDKYLIDNNIE